MLLLILNSCAWKGCTIRWRAGARDYSAGSWRKIICGNTSHREVLPLKRTLSSGNMHGAADHKKHSSRRCCKIHVSFIFTHAQSDQSLGGLQWKLCSTQQYTMVDGFCWTSCYYRISLNALYWSLYHSLSGYILPRLKIHLYSSLMLIYNLKKAYYFLLFHMMFA